ncbi:MULTISPECIES: hypothetical protein [unclassified Shinella]|uniref:hypothetical protein n=1 Tax=unclassified Shinella TaxID=2643062 RepID=UPI00234E9EE8|nr:MULTISPECIES: hypothetical protein [unclassified Shinella]MCO5139019.1 hypothetical protein [Shinella sp.]MDC7256252.1 hypothetical protein [Shinella sp. YE25]CAK7257524.1 protein of unknown function [Shinella sp. WSC3-e]
MQILNMQARSAAFKIETLDGLWEEASKLGEVRVDYGFGGGQYAEIRFKRPAGSWIMARGTHTDIREALRLAIEEALAIGATRRHERSGR